MPVHPACGPSAGYSGGGSAQQVPSRLPDRLVRAPRGNPGTAAVGRDFYGGNGGGFRNLRRRMACLRGIFPSIFPLILPMDSLDSGQLTQMSEEQLNWLRQELAANTGRPTIIFFHAPLKGTLTNYRESINTPDFVAQPDKPIAQILRQHPQVFLWVSGHTHTAATQNDFAAPVNAWEGRIMNIHNADMDRETIWTNSLYLYPDKVVIRTFDHAQGRWLDGLERTIALPALPKRFWPWQR